MERVLYQDSITHPICGDEEQDVGDTLQPDTRRRRFGGRRYEGEEVKEGEEKKDGCDGFGDHDTLLVRQKSSEEESRGHDRPSTKTSNRYALLHRRCSADY